MPYPPEKFDPDPNEGVDPFVVQPRPFSFTFSDAGWIREIWGSEEAVREAIRELEEERKP